MISKILSRHDRVKYAEATNTLPRVHLYGKDRLSKDQENVIMRLGVRLSYDIKKD